MEPIAAVDLAQIGPTPRRPACQYRDPLDEVWIRAAERMALRLADLRRENASLRVQAALARPHGLRRFLANTTDHRGYYDALPDDPLTQDDDDTVGLARIALGRATQAPWAEPLAQALSATATIVRAVWPMAIQPSLYATLDVGGVGGAPT